MRDPQYIVPWLSPNIQLGRNTKNNFLDRRACQALVHPTIYPVHRPHIHHSGFFILLKCNFLKIISTYKEMERMDTDAWIIYIYLWYKALCALCIHVTVCTYMRPYSHPGKVSGQRIRQELQWIGVSDEKASIRGPGLNSWWSASTGVTFDWR